MTRSGDMDGLDDLVARIREEGTVRDSRLLNALLNGYARTLRWDRALELLEDWTAEGIEADEGCYAHVIRACVGARVPGRAREAEKLMRKAGLTPNLRIYSMLVTVQA